MASTFKSDLVTKGTLPRYDEKGVFAVVGTYELAGVALVINDIIQMVPVSKDCRVLDVILDVDDLDTGAAAVLAVGDGTTADRFITASNVAQAGGIARMAVSAASGYQYAADDTIDIKVTTAPQTGTTTGTLRLTVLMAADAVPA